MQHHIHKNTAPVTGYDDPVPNELADAVQADMAGAIEHLQRATLRLDMPRQFYTDMNAAVQFLIERYEQIRTR